MRPRLRGWATVLIALLCLPLAIAPLVPVTAQSGGTFDLRANVIAGGGDTSTGSGSLQISGTVGGVELNDRRIYLRTGAPLVLRKFIDRNETEEPSLIISFRRRWCFCMNFK